MKKIVILVFLGFFVLQLRSWFTCQDFRPAYHFSVYELRLSLDNLIHNDSGLPFPLIRLFHNKFTLLATSIYTSYLLFWDIKFLVNLFLLSGIFGIFCGFYYGYKALRKEIFPKLLVLLMAIFPFVEIIINPPISFPWKITIFSLPYEIFSLFGLVKLVEAKKGKWIYFFLVLVVWFTLWWILVLPQDFKNYCV